MIRITGKHNEAIVYTEKLDAEAERLTREPCDAGFAAGSVIRVMPDVHTGRNIVVHRRDGDGGEDHQTGL